MIKNILIHLLNILVLFLIIVIIGLLIHFTFNKEQQIQETQTQQHMELLRSLV